MPGSSVDRTTTNVMLVVFLALAVYAFSPPLVAFVMIRSGLNDDAMQAVVSTFYAPLVFLYDHFPPYRSLMDFCFHALGVN